MKRTTLFLVVTFALCGMTVLHAQSPFERAKAYVNEKDFAAARDLIRQAVEKAPSDVNVLAVATQVYLELDIHDTALVYATRLYEEDKNVPAYARMYAVALMEMGKNLEAADALRKSIRKNDELASSNLLVDALIALDSIQAAELVATTAKNKHENDALAYVTLGNLYFKYGKQPVYDLARQNYQTAVRLDSTLLDAHIKLAQCYWKLANRESDQDLANELFKRCLLEWGTVSRLDPKNAQSFFEQGKIYYLSARYADATKTLVKYRELRPVGTGNPLASWYLGNSYYEQRQCDSAQRHLEDAAAQIDSVRGKASLQMARCNFFAKNFKRSADLYKTIAGSNSMEPLDVWYYGAALVVSGDTATAITVMNDAAAKDPKQCGFMFRYGLLLMGKGKTKASTDIFRQRLANCKDSNDARIHAFIGNNFFADSLVDSALAEYQLALQLAPNNGYFMTRVAETYSIKGDDAKARELYLQAITIGQAPTATADDKRTATAAMMKLNAQDLKTKKWADIKERCQKGLELDPKSVGLTLYLAISHQGLGEMDSAKKTYKKVLELDPSNATAKENLKAIP
ncbi:MAG: hypothetical protein JSS89_01820 [Bacteroidetes bacterium]|nr:hypothetical protein [Bacteroidota bacterium]